MAAEVPIPAPALNDPRAFEVFRVWFASNTMYMGLGRAFDEPSLWGTILAAVAREATSYYADDVNLSPAMAMREMKQAFDEECDAFIAGLEN